MGIPINEMKDSSITFIQLISLANKKLLNTLKEQLKTELYISNIKPNNLQSSVQKNSKYVFTISNYILLSLNEQMSWFTQNQLQNY